MTQALQTASWITLQREIDKCIKVIEEHGIITGYIDEIGMHLCEIDEAGVDIQPHCEASNEFEYALADQLDLVEKRLEVLQAEVDRRKRHRELAR